MNLLSMFLTTRVRELFIEHVFCFFNVSHLPNKDLRISFYIGGMSKICSELFISKIDTDPLLTRPCSLH